MLIAAVRVPVARVFLTETVRVLIPLLPCQRVRKIQVQATLFSVRVVVLLIGVLWVDIAVLGAVSAAKKIHLQPVRGYPQVE